ncbi:MAG: VOC family protein [bacterium]|jgi:catechol 2,3-dioxygenase-like lactoylglutathione lyase family enzyme
MISGLDHVNIETVQLEQTIRFYEEVLGLENGDRPPFDFPGAWLYAGGHPVIHLVEVEALSAVKGPIDHVAWIAQGYEEMKQKLEEQGVAFRLLEVPGSSIRQIFIQDPNGVRLELNFQGA